MDVIDEPVWSATAWRGGEAGNFIRYADGVFWKTKTGSVFERVDGNEIEVIKAFEIAYIDRMDAARPVSVIIAELCFDDSPELRITSDYLEMCYRERNWSRLNSARTRSFVTGCLVAMHYEKLPEESRDIDILNGFAAGLKLRPNRMDF